MNIYKSYHEKNFFKVITNIFILILLTTSNYLFSNTCDSLIFEENFNEQPDWSSTMHSTKQGQSIKNGDILPSHWDAIYQGTRWSPEKGFTNNHASLEILKKNLPKSRGYKGKSAVFWRESYSTGWKNWASDAQLVKLMPENYSELYIEFWIMFSREWYGRKDGQVGEWSSKFFRIGSWDGKGNLFNGAAGAVGPLLLWSWKHDTTGVRNVITFRGGPHGENYSELKKYAGSFNFSTHLQAMGYDGKQALLFDQVNGNYLSNFKGVIQHDQVFGIGSSWTKVGFYVAMNSAPGINDGIMIQWINDTQIKFHDDIPWVMSNKNNKMVGWNYFAIGGNDYFQAFPNELRYEDWYAIDDIKVYSKIPCEIKSSISRKTH